MKASQDPVASQYLLKIIKGKKKELKLVLEDIKFLLICILLLPKLQQQDMDCNDPIRLIPTEHNGTYFWVNLYSSKLKVKLDAMQESCN